MIAQISDKIFWGFNREFDKNNFNSFDELQTFIKNELIVFLQKNNLLNLIEIAEKLKLHNHEYTSYNTMKNSNVETIYLCGSCRAMV